MIEVKGEAFRLNAGKYMKEAAAAQKPIMVTHYGEPYMVIVPAVVYLHADKNDPNCPHCGKKIRTDPEMFGVMGFSPKELIVHCGSCGEQVTLQRYAMPHVRVKE